jgi:hypothetical protein
MSYYSYDSRGRSRRRTPSPDRHGRMILLPREEDRHGRMILLPREEDRHGRMILLPREEDATLSRDVWSPERSPRARSIASEATYNSERQLVVVQRRRSPSQASQSSRRAGLLSPPIEGWQQRPGSASARLPSEIRPRLDGLNQQGPGRIGVPNDSTYWDSGMRSRQTSRGASYWFRHRSLSRPRRQFRLIKVLPYKSGSPTRCVIRHLDRVDDSISWTAVSYTWGDERARESILLSDVYERNDPRPMHVTENLQDILTHIAKMQINRRQETRWSGWWWIDALCIIQDDNHPEKDIQIMFMPEIYGSAREVIAWIGPGDSITDEAMLYIRSQPSTFLRAVAEGSADARLESFEQTFQHVAFYIRDIFNKKYWDRLWILQELAMARNTTLVCGTAELPWRTFIDFATQVVAADFGPSKLLRQVQGEIAARQPVWLLTRIHDKRTRGPNLAKLVFLSKDSVCGRDKKDYIRRIHPEIHRSACSIISDATRAIVNDMRRDSKTSLKIKSRCEKLAQLAHHQPLIDSVELERTRSSCTEYAQALYDCREIASVLYEHRVLLSRRINGVGETWDFEAHGMRRRRSRTPSRSRSRNRSERTVIIMGDLGL